MFVDLGGEKVVYAREVVAILDARRLGRAADARALLARASTGLSGKESEAVRTVVVTTRGLIVTPSTPATVAKRVRGLTKTRKGPTAER